MFKILITTFFWSVLKYRAMMRRMLVHQVKSMNIEHFTGYFFIIFISFPTELCHPFYSIYNDGLGV